MREILDGIGNAGNTCGRDETCDTSVMVWCRPNIPGISSSWGPGKAIVGFFVDNALGAGWNKGSGIEIEYTRDSGVRRKFGIVAALTEEVQGEFGLWKEAITNA